MVQTHNELFTICIPVFIQKNRGKTIPENSLPGWTFEDGNTKTEKKICTPIDSKKN